MTLNGYGSIPIHTIFRGIIHIHKSQLFWCELQGDRVLTHPQLPVTSVPKNPPRTLRWYSSTSMPQRSAHEAPRFHIDLEWSGMPVSIILKSYQINLNIFKSCIKNIISCLLSSVQTFREDFWAKPDMWFFLRRAGHTNPLGAPHVPPWCWSSGSALCREGIPCDDHELLWILGLYSNQAHSMTLHVDYCLAYSSWKTQGFLDLVHLAYQACSGSLFGYSMSQTWGTNGFTHLLKSFWGFI